MAYKPVCKEKILYEGELVPCRADGHELLIMWPDGGRPRAWDAACPHEDVSLARGVFNGRTLICIAHGWVFDGRNGEGLSPTGCEMTEYPMRVVDGMVEVDLPD
ncbi:Rieske 2Fe-2S domain-containing protein [Methyloversatilis thermotolerans]|uniref:Rieske 2Fe-2S domain-containing protein n=1 Tax=Methyloversatilis thermotolerans TaxID=1346290 RepID=UPI000362585C|nr:Rieske 2Fe-2S domain-containing protein [Methyloversatilis thermotolerans]